MRFTPEQSDKMLGVRREHLRRLQRIYEDRRQVNLEAISVLVRTDTTLFDMLFTAALSCHWGLLHEFPAGDPAWHWTSCPWALV